MTTALQEGDFTPAITLPATSGGGEVALNKPEGRFRVIYFYPRDNTPGCTTEGQDFSAQKSEFEKLGADIIGISKDSLKSHERFIEKQDLSITLAADEDGAACEAFGVWVEKKMYGRTSMGIERSTFLIDEAGRILKVWRKVRVKGHVDAVLEALRAET